MPRSTDKDKAIKPTSRNASEDITAVANSYWNLERLYADLAQVNGKKPLSPSEQKDLRALLLGYSPDNIAETLGIRPDTVRGRLSSNLYPLIKDLVLTKTGEVVKKMDYTQIPGLLRSLWYDRGRNGAPEVSGFSGRTEELKALEHWIVNDRCRLIVLWGMTGIGKTALSVKLMAALHLKFDWTIWRSLESAPPLTELLSGLAQQLPHQTSSRFETAPDPVQWFVDLLRTHRYLFILDGMEAILNHQDLRNQYSRLLKRLGESPLQSCVIVTSQEKLKELVALSGNQQPTRFLKLQGLAIEPSKEIFREHELQDEPIWQDLIEKYRGHPFFLKQLSLVIQNQFNGKASKFLQLNTVFLGDFPDFFAAGLEHLGAREKDIMQWLSTRTAPALLGDIAHAFERQYSASELLHSLECLLSKDFIETVLVQDELGYQLIPVVKKIMHSQFSAC